ncbi:hypothetical protein SASPL_148693 [Salvia splendens]|uniref:Uncharacterized protein n=1 Tax=Salvia splendens TaxID=180675 RepID=A0A8X8Z4K5_SALSN|nr:hypothetical protein SASPL_148693 [Salvia splendens]
MYVLNKEIVREMSANENVVAGKLRLKGKAFDARNAAIRKKRKHRNRNIVSYHAVGNVQSTGLPQSS